MSIEMQGLKRVASWPSSSEREREHAIDIEKSSLSVSSRLSQIPPSPLQNQLPQAPGQDQLPQAPGQDQQPQAPGQNQLPQAPGQDQLPQAPGQDQQPQAPGQNQQPQAPGQNQQPQGPGQDELPPPQDPPLNDYISQLFLKDYEPWRPFFLRVVVYRGYFRSFSRGVAIACLVYFLHMVCLVLVRLQTHSPKTWIDRMCKGIASILGLGCIYVYYKLRIKYRNWATQMTNRSDNAKYVPAFLENFLHLTCGSLFAIVSMLFGQWFPANTIEMHVFTSLAAFVYCMSLSRWSIEDFGLLDGIIAVILSLIYVIMKAQGKDEWLYLILPLAAVIPALRFALIPFGNRIREWIGELTPDDNPICPNWFTIVVMLVIAGALLAPYYCYNIEAHFDIGKPFNHTRFNHTRCNCTDGP